MSDQRTTDDLEYAELWGWNSHALAAYRTRHEAAARADERAKVLTELEATHLKLAKRTVMLRGDGCYENQACRDDLCELIAKLRGAP